MYGTKVYDTLNCDTLWKVVKELRIPDKMLEVVICFNQDIKASVISDRESSDLFTNVPSVKYFMTFVLFAIHFSF